MGKNGKKIARMKISHAIRNEEELEQVQKSGNIAAPWDLWDENKKC